ncbi:FeoB-associated Cys-rich membrane protein [Pedobacter sp. HMF7647]|uniref:FeoB-associated Cys-rich membrane protein n=1 Tax=Hufsiella arboris TaxID=2695275 RepID=A0A7K1YAQ3_9SPHI|nr:FeoB-associated Cys-rich membrane protein [Hufsiella arboris]MXV51663.1 FeoB-associated Cys-rich membrane protein [Hufsiella arboris]
MNSQLVLVGLIFLAAVFYIGRMIYGTLQSKKGCGQNCKCGVDFSAIEPVKPRK